MRVVREAFDADTATVGEARRFVAAILSDWGLDALDWQVALLVSELATNAVLHGRSAYEVELVELVDGVRLSVSDSSPRRLRERRYGTDATTGRGLRLVAATARAWGTEQRPDGKTVWVEVSPQPDEGGPFMDIWADDDLEMM